MTDKKKHFFASALITLVVLVLFAVIPYPYMWGYDKAIALFFGIMAGASKEIIWDKWLHKGTPEFYDFMNSLWGSFSMMFAWVIVETFILEVFIK